MRTDAASSHVSKKCNAVWSLHSYQFFNSCYLSIWNAFMRLWLVVENFVYEKFNRTLEMTQPEITAIGPNTWTKNWWFQLDNPLSSGNYRDTMWQVQSDTDFSVNSNMFVHSVLTGNRNDTTLCIRHIHDHPNLCLNASRLLALTRLGISIMQRWHWMVRCGSVKYTTRISL